MKHFTENKQWIFYGILGGSLAFNMLNIFMPNTTDTSSNASFSEENIEFPEDAIQGIVDADVVQTDSPSELMEVQPTYTAPTVNLSSEWKVLKANVDKSLIYTLQNAGVENADALSMVYSRLFVWDINMTKDLMKGDQVEAVYKIGQDGHPDIVAARLHSKKHDKTFTAFKWKSSTDKYASYWMYDGAEALYQLQNSPIKEYEQVTSLLKDGRNHKGMDFKAPVGTPTYAPKSAKVTRVNFGNFRYNGNCVELEYSDGTIAKYLHMEKIVVKEGSTVKAGDLVALVGNTGRSFAPHLHYQLEKGNQILDPLKYHGTYRRKLSEADIPHFLSDIGSFINAMDTQHVAER